MSTEIQGIVLVPRSLVAEADVKFGAALEQGASAGTCKQGTDEKIFAGIALPDAAKTDKYVQYDMVQVAKMGLVPCILEKSAITANPEAIPEGSYLTMSANAGQLVLTAVAAESIGRIAEDASFLAGEVQGVTKISWIVIGAQ